MLKRAGDWALRASADMRPWSNVYGLARTLLAIGTMLTLLGNDASTLFVKLTPYWALPQCGGVGAAGVFCLLRDHLEVARWIGILVLAVVASGYRPRVTGVLHFWVTMGVTLNTTLTDGGDQIAYALTFIVLPITLADPRRWHWEAPAEIASPAARVLAASAIFLARAQMAGLYFHAAAGKYATAEWANGTAMYFILTEPVYGAPDYQLTLLRPLLVRDTVAVITWSVMVLEFVLAGALFAQKRYWPALLVLGVALHVGIGLMQGLVTFGLAMCAGLVLLLRPTEQPFAFVRARSLLARVRRGRMIVPTA